MVNERDIHNAIEAYIMLYGRRPNVIVIGDRELFSMIKHRGRSYGLRPMWNPDSNEVFELGNIESLGSLKGKLHAQESSYSSARHERRMFEQMLGRSFTASKAKKQKPVSGPRPSDVSKTIESARSKTKQALPKKRLT